MLGLLTPALVGLVGVYLVLEGQAWSLLWIVLVLLFVACLKAKDLFTIVVVLLLGAAIGWAAVQGGSGLQAGLAVALVWLLLLGGLTLLSQVGAGGPVKSGPGDPKKLVDLTPGPLVLAVVWLVAIIALWVGARRLLGV